MNTILGFTNLLDRLKSVDESMYLILSDSLADTKGLTTENLVDTGYLCKQLEEQLDEMRKTIKARRELIVKLVGAILAQQQVEDASVEDTARGKLATLRVEAHVMPKLPKKGEGFEELLVKLKVPEEARNLVKLDFQSVSDYLTHCAEQGVKPPVELSQTWTEFRGYFRGVKTNG